MTQATGPDLQPTLEGDLVEVRPIKAPDWPEMFAAAADPLVWELHPVRTRYQEPIFRHFFDEALSSRAAFTIRDRRTGRVIGSSRYYDYRAAASEIEIGWTFLARSHWGGAYNGEIKRLMLDHAFGFAETVVFWVGEHNTRSQRAVEKIGGRARAQLRDRVYHGETVRHVVYEIHRPTQAGR